MERSIWMKLLVQSTWTRNAEVVCFGIEQSRIEQIYSIDHSDGIRAGGDRHAIESALEELCRVCSVQ